MSLEVSCGKDGGLLITSVLRQGPKGPLELDCTTNACSLAECLALLGHRLIERFEGVYFGT